MNIKTLDHFVGNTPLVKLQRLNPNPSNTILLKLEGINLAHCDLNAANSQCVLRETHQEKAY